MTRGRFQPDDCRQPIRQALVDTLSGARFLDKIARVLVVEDEILVRLDLVYSLEGAGFSTLEAGSADEAITILEGRSDIRVVFTDIQMPGSIDGMALAHCVRKRWPPTILVVSSGRQRPAGNELPSKTAFLTKPYHPVELSRLLDRISAELLSW